MEPGLRGLTVRFWRGGAAVSCRARSCAGLNGEICCRSSELWSSALLPEPICDD